MKLHSTFGNHGIPRKRWCRPIAAICPIGTIAGSFATGKAASIREGTTDFPLLTSYCAHIQPQPLRKHPAITAGTRRVKLINKRRKQGQKQQNERKIAVYRPLMIPQKSLIRNTTKLTITVPYAKPSGQFFGRESEVSWRDRARSISGPKNWRISKSP
jgi:hypothetical protein